MAQVQLASLQAIRAIAALMVVAFHLEVYILPDVLGRSEGFWRALLAGYSGVEVFFVLSGFIMMIIHKQDFGSSQKWKDFARKRIIRIYPFYWIVLAVVISARVALDGTQAGLPDGQQLLKAVFLYPNFEDPIIRVAWTLSFEMLFYSMFSLLILNFSLGRAVVAAWFVATLLALMAPGDAEAFLLSPYNLLFLFGILAGMLHGLLDARSARLALTVGLSLFAFVGLSEAYGLVAFDKGVRTVLFGLGASGVLSGYAAMERLGLTSAPRTMVFLGDASYAIYLLHILFLQATGIILSRMAWSSAIPTEMLFALLFIIAVAGGAGAHLLIEKPLLSMLRKGRRPLLARW